MLCGLLGCASPVHGKVLWHQAGPILARDNGAGEDVLRGAVPPQDNTAGSTLFFKFTVDPLSDISVRPHNPFTAGLVLCERGREHLGVGLGKVPFAYSAFHATGRGLFSPPPEDAPEEWNGAGEYDLNCAFKGVRGGMLDHPHRGVLRTILFRVQYIPGGDAEVTVWFQPDLTPGQTESTQLPGQVTRFKANAAFDEVRLIHRDSRSGIGNGNGYGDGWVFSDLAIGTSFDDFVTPHFWQRGWVVGSAGLGLVLLIGGAGWLMAAWRSRRELRQMAQALAIDQERARIARDLHDELGARLTQIQLLGHPDPGDADGREQRLLETSRQVTAVAGEMIETLDGIVWAVNPRYDTLLHLADYLARFADEFFRPTPIRCRLDVPVDVPSWPLTAQQRHHLLLIVKEACHNVVRHSRASEVWLRLHVADGEVDICIEDNGCGFDPATVPPGGSGLQNQRDRIHSMGGRMELDSAPGQGTRVKLVAPLRSK